MAENFRRDGWELDMHRPRSVVCPHCQITRGYRVPAGPSAPAPEKVEAAVKLSLVPKEDIVNTTSQQIGANAVLNPPSRRLTPDEREKIRAMLDKHFDTERGCFTNGSSDQHIGRTVNVPWHLVKELREIAYGELKGDPETIALKDAIAGISARLTRLIDHASEIESEIKLAQSKLDILTKRFTS